MSLVGFKAQNHPQQTPKDRVDDRAIKFEDFAPLHERFRFTIDAAASKENARLPRFWTADDDALTKSWHGHRVWCNPPYSNIRPWVEKAQCEFSELTPISKAELVVMLLPANRTEQVWWQELIEPGRDGRSSDGPRVEFLRGRMRFDRPNAVIGPKGDRPPFGCCLVIWGNE